jgi:hypothetical protein
MVEVLCTQYDNGTKKPGTMRPVETVLRGGGIKAKDGGGGI